MSKTVLKVENLYKQYRLGVIGSSTLRNDLARWWSRIKGKEDPTSQLGSHNQLDVVDQQYVWALQDINFEVKQGEVLGIIGKNGAGKSTLLKLLSKVTSPTRGNIKVKGRIASLLEVGTGFHPELTGRENIFLNGAILGMHRHEIKAKFDEIVEFAGVAKYIDTPVKRYSSGMYVRLAFAVAAHLEPEILVVDEVLAVGDAEFQKKAIGKMKDVSEGQGRTVLFVSHNMSAVQDLCTRAILLNKGKLTHTDSDVRKIVGIYLSGNTDDQATTSDIIDYKNEVHSINKLRLTDNKGNQLPNNVTHSTEIKIQLEGEVFIPDAKLNIGYAVYNNHHEMVYWSWCKDDPNSYVPFEQEGRFYLNTTIPASYLNENTYKIEIISGLTGVKWLLEPGKFEIFRKLSIDGGFSNLIITPTFLWSNISN